RRRYSLGPSSTRPRTLGYPWARALPPSSRYADARCAGPWAWSRHFRKAVAIQPLNALTGHGRTNIATDGRRCRAENERGIGLCPLLCGCAQRPRVPHPVVEDALGV